MVNKANIGYKFSYNIRYIEIRSERKIFFFVAIIAVQIFIGCGYRV